jgi:hypothetical protein
MAGRTCRRPGRVAGGQVKRREGRESGGWSSKAAGG